MRKTTIVKDETTAFTSSIFKENVSCDVSQNCKTPWNSSRLNVGLAHNLLKQLKEATTNIANANDSVDSKMN